MLKKAMKPMTIGVLALQGAFSKHIEMLASLGVNGMEVRKPHELEQCCGLIIPGGESTTLFNRIQFINLTDPIKEFAREKPVFGTCAGLILMSKTIKGADRSHPFGFLDLEVERNAYGRQKESFSVEIDFHKPLTVSHSAEGMFIRAPRITSLSSDIKVLASYQGEPVVVQQGHFLGATCHPELTKNTSIHKYFLEIVKSSS